MGMDTTRVDALCVRGEEADLRWSTRQRVLPAKEASEPKTLRKFLSGWTLDVAFLSQLILDVLRGELSLIQHNTHEYISAKWLADW